MSIVNITPSRTFLNTGNSSYYTDGNVAIGKTVATQRLDISGDLNTDGKIKENGGDLIPSGLIIMWYGSIASIPSGWTLCNGTNGAPNLTNEFIICASTDAFGNAMTTITGDTTMTGGSTDSVLIRHNHTGTVDASGSHVHQYSRNTTGSWDGNSIRQYASASNTQYSNLQTSTEGAHSHTYTTNNTGSSRVNANIPPYIAIAYIMKL